MVIGCTAEDRPTQFRYCSAPKVAVAGLESPTGFTLLWRDFFGKQDK
jgi:hypothetical protein